MRWMPQAQTPHTLIQQKPAKGYLPSASASRLLHARPSHGIRGPGRGTGGVRQRPLGNPGCGMGQTHVWVPGRLSVRQECAGSQIPAPSAAANWKQSISPV